MVSGLLIIAPEYKEKSDTQIQRVPMATALFGDSLSGAPSSR
jgi:hypothetical protein